MTKPILTSYVETRDGEPYCILYAQVAGFYSAVTFDITTSGGELERLGAALQTMGAAFRNAAKEQKKND